MDKEPARDKELKKEVSEDLEKSAPQESAQDEKMDSYQPVMSHSKPGKKKFIIAAVVVAILLITFLSFKSNFDKSAKTEPKTENQPIQTQTPTPTPTPGSSLARSEWSLEVLNGSGITGTAKKVADKLRELGYTVIKTGNADRDDYELSQIFISSDFKDKVDLLVEDIKDVIKIASVAGELKDATASARIIIGKN